MLTTSNFVHLPRATFTERKLAVVRIPAVRCRHHEWSPRALRAPYYVENVAAAGMMVRDWTAFARDRNGTLVTRDGSYHPLRIAHFALLEHERFVRSGDEEALASFLGQATWLRDAANARADGAFPMPTSCARYGAPAGYKSAKMQGLAISALLRANEIDANGRFLAAAERAAMPFQSSIDAGGVVWRSSAGDAFLEDVAVAPAAHALAGFLLAFVGIFELQRHLYREWLGNLVGASIATLQRRLGYFDAGYWSFEDARVREGGRRYPAPLRIHDSHIALLRVCASMTGERYFEEMANSWSARVHDPAARARILAYRASESESMRGGDPSARWSWNAF